jgi:pantoate--beta-alanine ligase
MTTIVRSPQDLRRSVKDWRGAGATIALVPTMGALHAGHLDLVKAAKTKADKVIATIFVNPAQFAAHEDLGRYPRLEAADHELLSDIGSDLLYAPSVEAIYPQGFSTQVIVGDMTERLEGVFRPHFFAGVTTVVAKLFLQASPDFAFFGEKDWQQLQVVTKMARDLDLSIEIVGVPTRRESDGLAMSSRNAYLSAQERVIAPALKATLERVYGEVMAGSIAVETITDQARASLVGAGFKSVDYLEACHGQSLQPWQRGDPLRVLSAAWLGQTRLIDNWGG